jgi:DNA polymerase bacteriophage-type
MILFADTETRGDRFDDGVHIYATAGGAVPIVLSWACDRGPEQVREADNASLREFQQLVYQAQRVVYHGAEFDLTVLREAQLYVPSDKVHCTMMQAREHGLPGGLDKLCEVFRLENPKLSTGKRLIQLFCKRNAEGGWNDKHSHPLEWVEFLLYARGDIGPMRELYYKMPSWNSELPVERAAFALHREVNDRGFAVDVDLAGRVVVALAADKASHDRDMSAATGGAVDSGTQVQRLLEHVLDSYGVALPDLRASTIEKRLADESLDEGVKELLRLRLASAKSSTAKYKTLLRCVGEDGRVRGAKVFCGAERTGRFSAKILQTDNLPRPTISPAEQRAAVECFKSGTAALLLTDKPLARYASECLRGEIIAAPGHRLLVADYASVESRFTAWVCGEAWKLEAFRRYDRDEGPGQYELAYARCFNVPVTAVTKAQRQVGKVIELFCAYRGGVGAFLTGCETYHVNPRSLLAAIPLIPSELWEKSAGNRVWFIDTLHDRLAKTLEPDLWRVCFCLTRMWRRENPGTVRMWDALDEAFRGVQLVNRPIALGDHLQVDRVGVWTRIRLPSGRYLSYPDVQLTPDDRLHFAGVDRYSRKWSRIYTHGGKLLENISQGGCRDLLVAAKLNCACGTGRIVLHIHDEIILDQPVDDGWTVDRLVDRMVRGIEWADGLPLAADGFETDRYYKAT